MLTVGLLARINSESELAFILSHELAHDEREHVQQRIIRTLELTLAKKNESEFKKLFGNADDAYIKEVQEYKRLIYGASTYSRQKEVEADSLGFIFFSNAGYEQSHIMAVMNMLDSAQAPIFDRPDFFQPLNFGKYPFQEHWLKKRLSVYTRKPATGSVLFDLDSMETHPDMQIRKTALQRYIQPWNTGEDLTDDHLFYEVRRLSQFQTVENAYMSAKYDQSLYYIIQLLHEYPNESYLVSRAGKILLTLSLAKDDNTFEYYVTKYSGHYGERLRQVNTFLHNIAKEELLELAYHFMNVQKNFDTENPSHYYLLWEIAGNTERETLQAKVEERYRLKFDKKISAFRYAEFYGDYVPATNPLRYLFR
jgi:hypothetical protein